MNFEVMIGMGARINNIRNQQPSFEETSFSDMVSLGSLRIEGNFWDFLTTKVELMKNTFGLGRTTAVDSTQIYRERETVREVEVVYCGHCGTKNNARATFCSYCNASMGLKPVSFMSWSKAPYLL
jgi:ribosomal protein L40E